MAAQAMPYPGMYYGMQGMQPAFMDPHAAERQMQEYARLQQEQAKRRPELYGELDMSPIDRIPYIYIYKCRSLSSISISISIFASTSYRYRYAYRYTEHYITSHYIA